MQLNISLLFIPLWAITRPPHWWNKTSHLYRLHSIFHILQILAGLTHCFWGKLSDSCSWAQLIWFHPYCMLEVNKSQWNWNKTQDTPSSSALLRNFQKNIPWPMLHPFTTVHNNRLSSFSIILLTSVSVHIHKSFSSFGISWLSQFGIL